MTRWWLAAAFLTAVGTALLAAGRRLARPGTQDTPDADPTPQEAAGREDVARSDVPPPTAAGGFRHYASRWPR